jgi:hypothetical protein
MENITNGLLAFYKFTNSSDSSGNDFNLVPQNSSGTFVQGKIGSAVQLSNDWWITGVRHDLTQGFTVSCWVKMNSTDSLRPAVSQWQGGYGSFYIGAANENYVFATCHDQDVFNPTWLYGGTAALNQWVHMVGVYEGSTEKLFINGTLAASQASQALVDPSVGNFMIGSFDGGGEFVFDGEVDAVGLWNRALNTDEIAALYNSGDGFEVADITPTLNLNSGLQAFYKLDDTSDSSGNGNTLTNNGDVTFSSGKIGNAATLDGTNWFTSNSQITSEYTISGWFKSDTTNSYTMLFNAKNNETSLASFVQLLGDGSVRFGSGNYESSGELLYSGQNKNDNEWHFFCAVVGNNDTRLYLDGDAFASFGSQYSNFAFTEIAVGSYVDGSYDHLTGQIDAVGIWNRALNSAEIAALYNSGTGYEISGGVVSQGSVVIQGKIKLFGKVVFA